MKKADRRGRWDRLNSKHLKSFNLTTPTNKRKRVIAKLAYDCRRMNCGSAGLERLKKKIGEGGGCG